MERSRKTQDTFANAAGTLVVTDDGKAKTVDFDINARAKVDHTGKQTYTFDFAILADLEELCRSAQFPDGVPPTARTYTREEVEQALLKVLSCDCVFECDADDTRKAILDALCGAW